MVHRQIRAPLVLLLLILCPLPGCLTTTSREPGTRLRTERRAEMVRSEYRLVSEEKTDPGDPMVVMVRLERRDVEQVSERDISKAVIVRTRRTLSFEPRFFLWPVNLVRTPIGLVGCLWGTTTTGLHTTLGVLATVTLVPLLAAPPGEVAFAVLELPQIVLSGQPGWPWTRRWLGGNRDALKRYWSTSGAFIGTWWDFAWGYRAYPFIIMLVKKQTRQETDTEYVGDWQDKGEQPTDYDPVPFHEFTVRAGERETTVTADAAGNAKVDLRDLSRHVCFDGRLSLSVEARVDDKSVGRPEFAYEVNKLRGPLPPDVETDPTDGSFVDAARLRFAVTVTGDRKLKDISVSLNGQPQKEWKAVGQYDFTGEIRILLRPGPNRISVEATDEGGLKTTRDIAVELE